MDGISGHMQYTGHQISSTDLPDVAQEAGISERLPLQSSIGELENLAKRAEERNEPVRLGLPGDAILAKLLAAEWGHVERIYWAVSPGAIHGVLDQVRTTLVELVVQLRQQSRNPQAPSAEETNNAVHVAVYGDHPQVSVTSAQSGAGGTATAAPTEQPQRPWWRTGAGLWTIASVLVAVIIAIIGWVWFS
jgi:hypothetical protein